jgi:hypothetical protein
MDILFTTDRSKLSAKLAEVRHSIYGQIFVLTCLRDLDVDPAEASTLAALDSAIESLRHTANHTLHDIR